MAPCLHSSSPARVFLNIALLAITSQALPLPSTKHAVYQPAQKHSTVPRSDTNSSDDDDDSPHNLHILTSHKHRPTINAPHLIGAIIGVIGFLTAVSVLIWFLHRRRVRARRRRLGLAMGLGEAERRWKESAAKRISGGQGMKLVGHESGGLGGWLGEGAAHLHDRWRRGRKTGAEAKMLDRTETSGKDGETREESRHDSAMESVRLPPLSFQVGARYYGSARSQGRDVEMLRY